MCREQVCTVRFTIKLRQRICLDRLESISNQNILLKLSEIPNLPFRVVNGSSSSTLVNGLRVKSNGVAEVAGVIPHETMVYLIAGGITAFVFIISVLFFAAVCR